MNLSYIMRVILTGNVIIIYNTKTIFVEAVCRLHSTTTISTVSIVLRNGK